MKNVVVHEVWTVVDMHSSGVVKLLRWEAEGLGSRADPWKVAVGVPREREVASVFPDEGSARAYFESIRASRVARYIAIETAEVGDELAIALDETCSTLAERTIVASDGSAVLHGIVTRAPSEQAHSVEDRVFVSFALRCAAEHDPDTLLLRRGQRVLLVARHGDDSGVR